jgi:hypothetical protein
LALIGWRNYSHIGGSEIERARREFIEGGMEPAVIEQEYRDAKRRYRAAIKAGKDWDKRCGLEARDTTLRGLVAEFAERGLKVDYRSVWEFVHAKNLSFKKSVVASERDRPDVARRRAQWTKYQGQIEPGRLVFIDETWTKTNMATLRGWAPRGARLIAKVPHGHWKTTTFLAALRYDRLRHHGFSMVRSTVRASQFTSRRFRSRP